MNYIGKIRFSRTSFLIIGVAIICINCFLFQSCERDNILIDNRTHTDAEYETMLKLQIEKIAKKSSDFKSSFIITQGIPIWKEAKWVDTKSGKMFVVPLLTNSKIKKRLIGIVQDNEIIPVITQIYSTMTSSMKLYSIHNRIMYDSKDGVYPLNRLKSASAEGDEVSLNGLLSGNYCGTAEDLYSASNTGCNYNPYETFASIKICTGNTSGGSSASYSIAGHAWIEITTYYGDKMTFSLWRNPGGASEYFVNKETNFPITSSMSSSLTYSQFQSILDINSNCSNLDWSASNTCAGYSVNIWNAATGSSLDFGYITTPDELDNYINGN